MLDGISESCFALRKLRLSCECSCLPQGVREILQRHLKGFREFSHQVRRTPSSLRSSARMVHNVKSKNWLPRHNAKLALLYPASYKNFFVFISEIYGICDRDLMERLLLTASLRSRSYDRGRSIRCCRDCISDGSRGWLQFRSKILMNRGKDKLDLVQTRSRFINLGRGNIMIISIIIIFIILRVPVQGNP